MQPTEDMTNEISRLFEILLRRKWIVLSCILLVLSVVVYYTLSSLPVYKATVMVVCEEKASSIPDLGFQDLSLPSTFVVNQIQEITSWSLIREVVEVLPDTILESIRVPEPHPSQYERKEYLIFLIQKNISAVTVPKSEVIKIHIEAHDAVAACIIANTVAIKLKERNLNTRLEEIRSVEKVIEEQLIHFSRRVNDTEEALKAFKEKNRVTYLDEESVEIFKRITEAEVEFNRVQSEHEAARKRLQFVQTKLAQERKELIPSITIITSPWAQKLKENLVELEVQYTSLRVQNYSANHPKMKMIKSQIDETKRNLKVETLKIARGEDIRDPLSRIEQDLEEIASLEVHIYTYEAQERALSNILGNYDNLLKGVPDKELELGRIIRDKEVADNIYTMLLKQREEIKIKKAEKAGNVRIIDPALIPHSPIRPKKKLYILIGCFLGTFIGVGLALFVEVQDTRITTIQEVEKNMSLKVMGNIPQIRNGNGKLNNWNKIFLKNGKHSETTSQILCEFGPASGTAEAFRTLRTNIQSIKTGSGIKTILITSANPKEGKSFISSNLAIAMAQQGLKTLLIDADLRRPVLHKIFNIDRQPGLVDLLCALSTSGEVPPEIRDALYVFYKTSKNDKKKSFIYNSYIRNLFVLPSGMIPPNPSDFLTLRSMKELVIKLRAHFDVMIFDLPPITDYTDAAILTKDTDGILFIISAGKSKMNEFMAAKKSIEKVDKSRIIGAVLNNVHLGSNHGVSGRNKYYDKKNGNIRKNGRGKVIDRTLIMNRKSNKAFIHTVRNEIVHSNGKGKWAKVAPYL